MFPQQNEFPEFVADQLLTSEHLNQVFDYLDEQERMTRTNLIGIGIVCGLKVKTNQAGTSVTITKGCGVTSEGYLISIPDSVYTEYRTYDPVKKRYYNKFVDIATKKSKFNLYELVPSAVYEDSIPLSEAFLKDKVVLLFVELLEEQNKNCDPNSCDDKGINVTVTIRPLLVSKSDISTLNTTTDCVKASVYSGFPHLPLLRVSVPDASAVFAEDIVKSYIFALPASFIDNLQDVLTNVYNKIKTLVAEEFSTNPFLNFAKDFAFINDGSITNTQALHIQYYYDFFSDLLQAYDEFCKKGSEVFCGNCCPDAALFPRHLLLDEAIPSGDITTVYRHYFIYSPLFDQKDLVGDIKSLFRRIVFMYRNRIIPAPIAQEDSGIKITPSKLGAVLFSEKSIPYYYTPNKSTDILYTEWNNNRKRQNKANKNLSYNASSYNSSDDFVLNPLKYDLEPYNFLRIEGLIGKDIKTVSDTISGIIKNFRLPFQIVTLATGESKKDTGDDDCGCGDFELEYELLRNKILCCLKNNIKYWGSYEIKDGGIKSSSFQANEFAKEAGQTVLATAPQETQKVLQLFKDEVPAGANTDSTASAPLNLFMGGQPESSNIESTANTPLKLGFISESYAQPLNMAQAYLEYQATEKINMGSLPAPKTSTPADNISYYILIIIDESEQLAALLTKKIADFNADGFSGHADKLNKAYSILSKLITGYDTKAYLIEKIKINTAASYTADIDKISAAMSTLNEDEAYKIILLLLNLDKATIDLVITRLQSYTSNYTAQQYIINSFYNKLDKDGMIVPILKEPANYVSGYEGMLEQLRYGSCICDIENLIYLFKRYKFSAVNSFSAYAKNHPAIQHKAGVTPGGTFVIVYKGTTDPSKDITKDTVIADFYIPYLCCSDCPPVIIQVPPPPPDPITVTASDPECDKTGDNFSTTLTIAGGTPPYKVEGNVISGNSTTIVVKSGSSSILNIADSAGKTLTYTIPAHDCPKPCDLPCDGEAEKCRYILWIQKPKPGDKIGHITKSADLILTDENNISVPIPIVDIFKNVLDKDTILDTNYDGKFTELTDKLNTRIPGQFLGNGQPMFGYDQENQLLFIEKYACHKVNLEMNIQLSLDYNLHVIYDANGVSIEGIGNTVTKVPKFGCTKINKCTGKIEEICTKQIQINDIQGQREKINEPYFKFSANPNFDSYYWYFRDGRPLNSSEKEPQHIFSDKPDFLVRLTGINNDGCFTILEEHIKLS